MTIINILTQETRHWNSVISLEPKPFVLLTRSANV